LAGPIEKKVQASTGAAAVSGIVLWIIGRYIFKGSVPDVVASWTYVIVPALLTFAAGYAAKHTSRAAMPVITVNASAGSEQVGRQIVAAIKQYEDSRPAPAAPPAEKTLITPPAAEPPA
jgi:hypothetical protein